jgi:hypothetical protein
MGARRLIRQQSGRLLSCLVLMCDSQDFTLQAILSNGVATVRQTLSRVFSAMAAEWAKKGRKLVLRPDFGSYGRTRQLSALLVALTFVGSHVAAASVLLVGTRPAALIGLQQMTIAIGAATRVARINRRASREQSLGLGRAAIVLQGSELGVGVVQITAVVEIARAVAAQVVAI